MCLVHCCQGNVKFIIVQFLEICFHIDSVESAQPPRIWLLDLVTLPTLPLPEVSDFFSGAINIVFIFLLTFLIAI